MPALIEPFVRLCLFRLAPQQLPYSMLLLGMTLLANTIISTFALAVREFSFGLALLGGVLDSALMTGLTASLLLAAQKPARMLQTLTAVVGANAVVGTVAIPVFLAIRAMVERDAGSPLAQLLALVAFAWFIGVLGHILRHALGIHLVLATVVAYIMHILSHVLFERLLPLPAVTA